MDDPSRGERVRIVVPDYEALLRRGSTHLGLPAARSLNEALNLLTVAYRALSTRPGQPIALGRLDLLLAPFAEAVDLRQEISAFWRRLPTLPGPGYLTLGPDDSAITRTVLDLATEAFGPQPGKRPQVALRVDGERTPDDLVFRALTASMRAQGPLLVNDSQGLPGLGSDFVVVDGGIRVPVAGGLLALVKFDLLSAVLLHRGLARDYVEQTLIGQVALFAEDLARRSARVEAGGALFADDWLGRESLVDPRRFAAVFAVTGLAEAAQRLAEGQDLDDSASAGSVPTPGPEPAPALAPGPRPERLLRERIADLVAMVPIPSSRAGGGRAWVHLPSGRPGWTDGGLNPASTAIEALEVPAGLDERALVAELRRAFSEGVLTCRLADGDPAARRVTGFVARSRTGSAIDPGPADGAYVAGTVQRSTIDGPGERFVIFLQGCTYDCLTCHNPCSIPIAPAGMTRTSAADLAAGVASVVRSTTGSIPGSMPGSMPGRMPGMTLGARPGTALGPLSGVTVSGGEATLQAPFIRDLFDALRRDPVTARLTRFIDSNGDCEPDVWQMLAPLTDAVMLDVKALDDEMHVILTGHSNRRSLASVREVAALGLLHEVRLLVVPGLNDGDDTLRRTADWLLAIDPDLRVVVNLFRREGTRACARDLLAPRAEDAERYREVLVSAGVKALQMGA